MSDKTLQLYSELRPITKAVFNLRDNPTYDDDVYHFVIFDKEDNKLIEVSYVFEYDGSSKLYKYNSNHEDYPSFTSEKLLRLVEIELNEPCFNGERVKCSYLDDTGRLIFSSEVTAPVVPAPPITEPKLLADGWIIGMDVGANPALRDLVTVFNSEKEVIGTGRPVNSRVIISLTQQLLPGDTYIIETQNRFLGQSKEFTVEGEWGENPVNSFLKETTLEQPLTTFFIRAYTKGTEDFTPSPQDKAFVEAAASNLENFKLLSYGRVKEDLAVMSMEVEGRVFNLQTYTPLDLKDIDIEMFIRDEELIFGSVEEALESFKVRGRLHTVGDTCVATLIGDEATGDFRPVVFYHHSIKRSSDALAIGKDTLKFEESLEKGVLEDFVLDEKDTENFLMLAGLGFFGNFTSPFVYMNIVSYLLTTDKNIVPAPVVYEELGTSEPELLHLQYPAYKGQVELIRVPELEESPGLSYGDLYGVGETITEYIEYDSETMGVDPLKVETEPHQALLIPSPNGYDKWIIRLSGVVKNEDGVGGQKRAGFLRILTLPNRKDPLLKDYDVVGLSIPRARVVTLPSDIPSWFEDGHLMFTDFEGETEAELGYFNFDPEKEMMPGDWVAQAELGKWRLGNLKFDENMFPKNGFGREYFTYTKK